MAGRTGTVVRTQPVPAPSSVAELHELLDAGVLVDLGGRPLELRDCPTCPRGGYGETCPRSLPCPHCRAGVGSPCRRPSGHDAELHAARVAAADAVDVDRERAGDLTLPAPWPTTP